MSADSYAARSAAAQPNRYYGDSGTIHGSTNLQVEVDAGGNVVSVWFRCQMLPFEQINVGTVRAEHMDAARADTPELYGVEVAR